MRLSKVLMAALVAMLIIGVSGCMDMKVSKKYSQEEKKGMVLAYLQEKYDEEFVGKYYKPAQWGQNWDEYFVYPKKSTDEDGFQVRAVMQEDGTYKMSDGYFGIIIHDEYEKTIRNIVGEVYEEFKLFVDTKAYPTWSDRLNKGTKICDIYDKDEYFSPSIVIYIKETDESSSNLDEQIKVLKDRLSEEKLPCYAVLYTVADEKYEIVGTDLLKLNTYKEIKETLIHRKGFTINNDFEVSEYGEDR